MADAALLNQIRPGMQVQTSDGKQLGKVRHLHQREREAYGEVTPRRSPWKPWQRVLAAKRLFLPASEVTMVTEKQVQVAMDAKTAKGCTWQPNWIPRANDSDPYIPMGS